MLVRLLKTTDPAFPKHLARLAARGPTAAAAAAVERTVRSILRDVKARGDRALIAHTERLDGVALTPGELRLSRADLRKMASRLAPRDRKALRLAASRIASFHRRQRQASWHYRDRLGVLLGQRITPLERVGVYVPGGKAAYPSSLLMNVIPAKVAGVKEVVVVSPPSPDGYSPALLAAAWIAGADALYRVGGAQAVAALAYGTESIPRVDKIVGPGNLYVAAAKRMVFGHVDIDMIAGPSEVLVIADGGARADFVASDMLAQAEHDEAAAPLCVTTSAGLAREIVRQLEAQLEGLSRCGIARAALRTLGAVIVARSRREAVEVANTVAPEHLELMVREPARWLPLIRHAGAVFLGELSTEPFGDYVAGPNHVLPTAGTARFSSPLGVYEFLKRTSVIQASPRALAALGPDIVRLAEMEGLDAHGRAVAYRLGEEDHAQSKGRAKR
jgi:histidinol dehydrogenase